MDISKIRRAAAVLLAVATGLGGAGAAQAAYFVRPVLQYQGGLVDGLKLNGDTSNSLTYYDSATALEAHVDLADGTIKTYLSRYGPSDNFSGATGVIGEQIRYTGDSDVPVLLSYDFSASIYAYQDFYETLPEFDNRFIAIDAYFAVYEAGSGATWDSWTIVSPHADKALYNDRAYVTFQGEGSDFSIWHEGSLGTELNLISGRSYDIFAAFNLLVIPGAMEGWIEMDSLHTSTISIEAPGGELTSLSGEFLGFAKTPAGVVPEPASWAMMILGFGLVGAAARRRKTLCAA